MPSPHKPSSLIPSEPRRPKQYKRPLRRETLYAPGTIISKSTRIRCSIVGGLILCGFAGIAWKGYHVQISNREGYQKRAANQHLHTVNMPARRGTIYDRNRDELAVTSYDESVSAIPGKIVDVGSTAGKFSEILNVDIRLLETRLASSRKFSWLKRHITPSEAQQIRALRLPGIFLRAEPRRYYPGKKLGGHILGFVDVDGNGKSGLELSMDEILSGRKAKTSALRDGQGHLIVLDPSTAPNPGASITLTIDRSIQFATENALRQAVETHHAEGATAVVIDVTNGKVLAMANYPEYDPNGPRYKIAPSEKNPRRNLALANTYEMGSIMKPITVAIGLEQGVITPSTIIDTENGQLRIAGKTYHDSFHDRLLTVGEVIKRSSNIGALKISHKIGAEALHQGLQKFGFGQQTGIELPGEAHGILRDADSWGVLDLNSHSFGYAMTSTAVQVTAAMAAIGNDGVFFPPRIIHSVESTAGESLYQHKSKGRRVISPRTARQLAPMLESVFEPGKMHGTAHELYVPGHRVGGKSGTSKKLRASENNSHKQKYEEIYLSSFSGIAPIDNPRIAITVLVDEPTGGEHYGARVAGPAWTQIVSKALTVLGIPADSTVFEKQLVNQQVVKNRAARRAGNNPRQIERDRLRNQVPLTDIDMVDTHQESSHTDSDDNTTDGETTLTSEVSEGVTDVPDFAGLGIAKTLALARQANLQIEVSGSGIAIDQEPLPGPAINPGTIQVIFTQPENCGQ